MAFKDYARREPLIRTGLATTREEEERRRRWEISLATAVGEPIAEVKGRGDRHDLLTALNSLVDGVLGDTARNVRLRIIAIHGEDVFRGEDTTLNNLSLSQDPFEIPRSPAIGESLRVTIKGMFGKVRSFLDTSN